MESFAKMLPGYQTTAALRFGSPGPEIIQDVYKRQAGAVASSLKLDKIATTSFSSCSVNSPLGEFAIKEI